MVHKVRPRDYRRTPTKLKVFPIDEDYKIPAHRTSTDFLDKILYLWNTDEESVWEDLLSCNPVEKGPSLPTITPLTHPYTCT